MKSFHSITRFFVVLSIVFFIPISGSAWQITEATPVPVNCSAICPAPNGILCGYRDEEANALRIINPENGQVISEFEAPDEDCYGLAQAGQNYWFMGVSTIMLIDPQGEVIEEEEHERLYETMRGLVAMDDGLWSLAMVDGSFYFIFFIPGENETVQFVSTVQNPRDIGWDGRYLWATDWVDGFVHKFDPQTQEEVDLFLTPMYAPTGITCIDDYILLVDHGPNDAENMLYHINPSGETQPRIMPLARRFDFGIVDMFSASTVNFVLYNIGGENLEISSIQIANNRENGYILGNVPEEPVVASGEFVLVPISFEPPYYGHFVDTLIVESNDPEEPIIEIVLTGLGTFHNRRLGVYPDTLDFGLTRADPWRDGSSFRQLAIFNMSQEPLIVDTITYSIQSIFHFDQSGMPLRLETAETLFVNSWFTPHGGISYTDTAFVISNQMQWALPLLIRGAGNDSNFVAGTTLWTHHVEVGGAGVAAMRHADINNDDISEVVAVGGDGVLYCLNGFGSDFTDVIWTQRFDNYPFAPTGVEPYFGMTTGGDLNGDGTDDIIIGSGTSDLGLYGIDGIDGRLMWRWDAHSVGAEGRIVQIIFGYDQNGDGAADPVVLTNPVNGNNYRLIRVDGATGRPSWARNPEEAVDVAALDDYNRDGVIDFVVLDAGSNFKIYSGVDGALMDVFASGTAEMPIFSIGDINGDGWRDLITAATDGALTAWSIQDEASIWSVESGMGRNYEGVSFYADTKTDFNNDGLNEILIIDNREAVLLIDVANGEAIWEVDILDAISLDVLTDIDEDQLPDVICGTDGGVIQCLSGIDGTLLWNFDGRGMGSAVQVFNFDDIDLGNTADIIGVFSSGIVSCISSAGDVSHVIETREQPQTHSLFDLAPNPFNGTIDVRFSLHLPSSVVLSIYDVNGRMVSRLDLGKFTAGAHKTPVTYFEQDNLANGIYIFRLESDEAILMNRAVFLK